jgi:hypothetical protein
VTNPVGRFESVILCEDIRDEVGNKKSLMGVISGDLIVPSFPATLPIAVFLVYQPNADRDCEALFDFRIMQDDTEIVRAGMNSQIPAGQVANLILPKALMGVEKEVVFRLLASVNKGPEEQIIKKRIFLTSPY